MKQTKVALFGFLTLILLLSIAACSPSAPADQKESTGPADSGEIVVWAWSESEINGLAERFNQVYPNIKVKFVALESAQFLSKFQNALITGGELPDVTLQEIGVRGAMFATDAFENLEAPPYNFDRGVVFPQILPTMLNSRGEVVGIERELNPSGLCYKRDLALKYFGTEDPDELGALISDWDKFIAEGTRIAQETSGSVQIVSGLTEMNSILTAQYAKPIFEDDAAHVTDFFTHNLGLLMRMNEAGMVGKLVTYTPAWNAAYTDTENYIFFACAPWSPVWIVKANDPDGEGRWGITTAPERGFNLGGTAYGIAKNAKNKELAWTFIQWATTTDNGTKAAEDVIGIIVSRQANYKDGFPWEPDPFFKGQTPNTFLMENAAPSMQVRPISQYDSTLTDVMSLVTQDMTNNPNLTLDQAIQNAVTEMKNKLPAEIKVD